LKYILALNFDHKGPSLVWWWKYSVEVFLVQTWNLH